MPSAAPAGGGETGVRYRTHVSVIETILVFVVIPAVIYGLLGVLSMRSKFAATPRYRPGQEWDHPPVWWSANPQGLDTTRTHADAGDEEATPVGGSSGSW